MDQVEVVVAAQVVVAMAVVAAVALFLTDNNPMVLPAQHKLLVALVFQVLVVRGQQILSQ
jgi:hypothetical protein